MGIPQRLEGQSNRQQKNRQMVRAKSFCHRTIRGKGMTIEIRDGVDYMEDVRTLIETYTNRLGLDLAFQNLESELENPAKKYAPPPVFRSCRKA